MNIFKPALNGQNMHTLETLALAHVGDAVYDLAVRGFLLSRNILTVKTLHRETIKRVSAKAQSARMETLLPKLSEQERAVFLRGRNTQTGTIPKTATRDEYSAATGLEALVGFLYLSEQFERLNEIFEVLLNEEGL